MAVNPSALGQNKGLSELWKRLRFVFMAVIIYRIGTHIPIPGIDPDKLANIFQQNQGTLLDLFNMFSGGALERMSIMALNIMPYITASIIMSLVEKCTFIQTNDIHSFKACLFLVYIFAKIKMETFCF